MSVTFGAFTPGTAASLDASITGAILQARKIYYADYANGNDYNAGTSLDTAVKTIAQAYALCEAGKNDAVVIVGDGTTTATQRFSSLFTWAKNATHLIGLAAPSYNPRARLAVLAGSSAYAAFFKVTASGCKFVNFSVFNDNAIAAQITWQDQGGRNYYNGVELGGIGDATSAASTTSRVLKLGGSGASGENLFENCIIGLDTVPRTVANATLEFAGGSKRNLFRKCLFPLAAGATTALTGISSGTNPLETFQLFDDCIFHNPYPQSSALLQAALFTLPANGNGRVIVNNCARFGVTDWGTDATSLAQIYVFGAGVGATDDVGRGSVAIAS